MEGISQKIQRMLDQSLKLYQDLTAVLEQEKEHILEMDLDGIWTTTHQKNKLMIAIQKKNSQLESAGFKGISTINALPVPSQERSMLKTAVMDISSCKENIARLAEANRTYTMEYMSIIDSIFSTLTQKQNSTQYGNSGGVIANQEKKHFICAEV